MAAKKDRPYGLSFFAAMVNYTIKCNTLGK
jgi:hypothetical protein